MFGTNLDLFFVNPISSGKLLWYNGTVDRPKTMEEIRIMKNRKIIHKILLAELLICTAFLIYSIVIDPFGEHDIMFALAITAGFIVLGQGKEKRA